MTVEQRRDFGSHLGRKMIFGYIGHRIVSLLSPAENVGHGCKAQH